MGRLASCFGAAKAHLWAAFAVEVAAMAGRLDRAVSLWTDYPDQQTVWFRIGCRVE